MEEYLSPAFYMIPAIDDTKNNTIYLNRGHLPDEPLDRVGRALHLSAV